MLLDIARALPPESVSVRELLERIGEKGLLVFCLLLNLPFLLPVSIPGVSTVFGLLVALVGAGVMLGRLPWLPDRLMERRVASVHMVRTLEHGSRFLTRLEKMVHPRLGALAQGYAIERWNGFMLFSAGILLMAPFGLIPFSNTLPGLAACFIVIGTLERDGLFILLGYLTEVGTVVYFAGLIAGAVAAGSGIYHMVR